MLDALGGNLITTELGNKENGRWQRKLRQESAQAFVGQRRPRDEAWPSCRES